ncbi:haloacid dehalogenase type II [Flavobacterium yafengii]|uniref:haloacid dehalogenase type II n=1 Tax=Flavobacterium yafengii TaxID=3041253 RepID=UPI0024A8475C|nr:haloacid dehalogenase type II [Flavobacterium yafengii]MDI6045879.1 haloacid dehalogenase type II [Flavobacterium yafengii]
MKEFKNSNQGLVNTTLTVGEEEISAPILILKEETDNNEEYSAGYLQRPKVLFFDVNETLLDLNSMKKSIGAALGGHPELMSLWFTTMLQYSLVTTVANQYHDFGTIGAAALIMVAHKNGIDITDKQAKDAVAPILSLPAHPEVKEALLLLRREGFKLVAFTNSSNKAVEMQLKYAGIHDLFDDVLSIEDVGKFKPHADTYNWAAKKMGLKPNECMLIAAHGWDVAGANWAGWQTAFVSRPGQQLFPLANLPEINKENILLVAQKLISIPFQQL